MEIIDSKAVEIDMMDEIGKLTLKVIIESDIDHRAMMAKFDDGKVWRVPIFLRVEHAKTRMRIAAWLIKFNLLIGWLTGMEVKLFEYDPSKWDQAMRRFDLRDKIRRQG